MASIDEMYRNVAVGAGATFVIMIRYFIVHTTYNHIDYRQKGDGIFCTYSYNTISGKAKNTEK